MAGRYSFPIEQIITADSALRRIPANLEPNQRLCLESIRLCVDAIGMSYARLVVEASVMGSQPKPSVAMLLDSWAIVDWVHRMHDLVKNTPRLPNGAPKQLFLRETASADTLRNAFQHLTGEYAKGQPTASPLGSLAWVFPTGPSSGHMCVSIVGTLPSGGTLPS